MHTGTVGIDQEFEKDSDSTTGLSEGYRPPKAMAKREPSRTVTHFFRRRYEEETSISEVQSDFGFGHEPPEKVEVYFKAHHVGRSGCTNREERLGLLSQSQLDSDEQVIYIFKNKMSVKVCSLCQKENAAFKCSVCKSVWYCSSAHQNADWARHKRDNCNVQ